MSFTSQVKEELCKIEFENDCCLHSYAYGFLLFSKSFSARSVYLHTDYENVMNSFYDAVFDVTGVMLSKSVLKSGKFTCRAINSEDRINVLESFDHSADDVNLRINYGNFDNECCYSAFLRGVFQSCGTISNPDKGYHLEFVVPYYKLSQDLLKFLINNNLKAKYILRKYSHVIYLKDSESIEDALTMMGAVNSSLQIMGIKIEKNVRNNINRQLNFESANLSRAIEAGLAQVEAIELIERKQGFESLTDELKEVAVLRKENPDMSLKQIGESLKIPISRSGVNHRLMKLMEIADKYR